MKTLSKNRVFQEPAKYNYIAYEGIQVGYGTDERPASAVANQYNLIHSNTIQGWSHAQIALYSGEYNEVYNNYIYDDGGGIAAESSSDFSVMGISINGRHNKIYNNYIEKIHYDRINGQDNEIYNNVFHKFRNANTRKDHYTSCVLMLGPNKEHPWDISGNKIYNNIFYNAYEDYHGGTVTSAVFLISAIADYEHNITNNEFSNNIILEWRLNTDYECDYAIYINDNNGKVSGNIFKNNSFYKTGGATDPIIRDEGTSYTVAAWDNADPNSNTCSGNITTDPGLEDPANGKFWPSSESSNVVNVGATGYVTIGLDSSSTWTPEISIETVTRTQPDIGPYEFNGLYSSLDKVENLRILQ